MGSTKCANGPGSPWDYAFLVVVISASVPFVAANIVVLVHRRRRFFRSQGGALLILTSSIAGLVWIAATFVTNSDFPRNHLFLRSCTFWKLWLQRTFGFWLWLACQALRLIHLYILCQNAAASTYTCRRLVLLWALLLWTPGLAFTIAATVLNAGLLKLDGDGCGHCGLQGAWKHCATFVLPALLLSVLVVLLIYTKRQRDYMMAIERSRTGEYSFVMIIMLFVICTAPYVMGIQQNISGRCFVTFGVCCIVFINFWVRIGWPVYLCLFKKKAEMDSFEKELRSRGADCLGELNLATGISGPVRRRSFARQYNDWIWTAIDDAMNELSECKEMINRLEQRKVALSTKLEQLEGSTTPESTTSSLFS